MNRKIIPHVLSESQLQKKPLFSLTPQDTVEKAVECMAKNKIGVIAVLDAEEKLKGIFSERDLLNRVVAVNLPMDTLLKEVMTTPVKTVQPDDDVQHALGLMDKHNFRHLPVETNCNIIGMISIKDLYKAMISNLNADIEEREAFIHGSY